MEKSYSVSFINVDPNSIDEDSKVENEFEEVRQSFKISEPNKSKLDLKYESARKKKRGVRRDSSSPD